MLNNKTIIAKTDNKILLQTQKEMVEKCLKCVEDMSKATQDSEIRYVLAIFERYVDCLGGRFTSDFRERADDRQ